MSVSIFNKHIITILLLSISSILLGQKRLPFIKALTFQTGGYMGVLAIGGDYLSKKDKILSGVYYAFSPQFITTKSLHSITWRTTYSPIRIRIKKQIRVFPVSLGISVVSTFGPELWTDLPGYYPRGYYELPTRLNLTLYTGSRIQWLSTKKIEGFYELGTSYRLVEAWYENKNVTLWDIANLSLGVRLFLH